MAKIFQNYPLPSKSDLSGSTVLTLKELSALAAAPKKSGTSVTVRAYPVKLGGIPLLGREHMYTEYSDGQHQYIYRGGPSMHGLHVQVDPSAKSPDRGRGVRIVQERYLPGVTAEEAAMSARRTARRIEGSGAIYGVLNSNSNTAVAEQMQDQFGYRVGDRMTPGWRRRPMEMPSWLRTAPYLLTEWTGEGVRP